MSDVLAWITGLVAAVVPGFGDHGAPTWSGYIEADYVYASAASPGLVDEILVSEGEAVDRGAPVLVLAASQQRAMLAAAEARVAAARASLENLETGSRQEEVDVIEASLSKAVADRDLATTQLARSEELFKSGLIPKARLDQDRATAASAEAQVRQLDAQLSVARLPARDAQQLGAEANLRAAEADAERARSDLADRTVRAPAEGVVDRLFFHEGELAPVGVPVLSLLPGGALKAKFYVGQAERMAFAVGDAVAVTCDGCPAPAGAEISYLAAEPQNTPPIIYSREERGRLVFLVEARLEPGAALLPGQPVTVTR